MKTYRTIYLLAATAFMLGACSDNDELDGQQEQEQPATQEGGALSFGGTIAGDMEILPEEDLDGGTATDSKTRASINASDFTLTWETKDTISISDGTLNYSYSASPDDEDATKATLSSSSSKTFEGTDGTYYALYPADAVISWSGSSVTTMIWTEQDYTENAESSGVIGPYMAASATASDGSANFTFGHICSVIDLDISSLGLGTDETVDAVSIYANSQVSLAGKLTFDYGTKVITVKNDDATGYSYSTQSEMVCVSNVSSSATSVRFYVLPVAQTSGFTFTVRTKTTDTSGNVSYNYYTKSSSTSVGTGTANSDYMSAVYNGSSSSSLGACLPYYKKYNFGSSTASNVRNMNWMAMIPGNVKFTHLSIPGTHDAATKSINGTVAGVNVYPERSKCQDYSIGDQLSLGCRAFDLRPYYDSDSLTIYHGSRSTGVNFNPVLDTIANFLTNNPTETVFVLVHQEEGSESTTWMDRVWTSVSNHQNYIASYGWKGNLNPCRGKMVVIFRDNYATGTNTGDLGCGKVGWGGSFDTGASHTIAYGEKSGTTDSYHFTYQDEYSYSSDTYANDKLANLTTMLTDYIAAHETDANYLFINNTNAIHTSAGVTDQAISTTATAVNAAVLGSTTFTHHDGRFGIMFTDYLFVSTNDRGGDKMFNLIHNQNFNYVYKNRTRCHASSVSNTGASVVQDGEYADGTTVYTKKR